MTDWVTIEYWEDGERKREFRHLVSSASRCIIFKKEWHGYSIWF